MTFTSSSSTARFLLLIAAAYTVTASAMIGEVLDTNRRQGKKNMLLSGLLLLHEADDRF